MTTEAVDQNQENIDKNAMISKANDWINAKYSSSLLENQLTNIGLSRVKNQNGDFIATISSKELRKLINLKDNNSRLYDRLITAAENMGGRTIVLEDEKKGNFQIISVITDASYVDGVFSIRYNSLLSPFFNDLHGRYTSYALANILNLKHQFSDRIYELLKSHAFKINQKNPIIPVDFGLSEFKCEIGAVNINTEPIRKELKKEIVDWDKIVDMADEKKYMTWRDFRSSVLLKAQKEINENCDIRFEFEPIRTGRGGKTTGIRFYIQKNDKNKPIVEEKAKKYDKINDDYEQLSMFKPSPELLRYVGHNELRKKDITMFLDEAIGDNNLVISAIKSADKQEHIKNYVGWIRTCIRRGGYDEEVQVMDGSAETARRVNAINADIMENQDELARSVWDNAKEKYTEKFQGFEKYLMDNGMNVDMFETVNTKAQCGLILLDWSAGRPVKLM